MKIGFLVAGIKGMNLLSELHRDCEVAWVGSHEVGGYDFSSLQRVRELCSENGYPFVDHVARQKVPVDRCDLVLIAGWRYLVDLDPSKLVVFHDSLLPRYRGFAPTVSALINGEKEIGVTAFRPAPEVDTGEVIEAVRLPVEYPAKVRDVYSALAKAYGEAARRVVAKARSGAISTVPQNEADATYCIWRDSLDYRIDWTWTSEKIRRFVDAVGWPYSGATTNYGATTVTVHDVEALPDLNFIERHPGKIWALKDGAAVVVCGRGMIRIDRATGPDGKPYRFEKVRVRLGDL